MTIKVLFLCTGNSARSQMAEHILRELGGDHFEAYSAGTHPRAVHPMTIKVLDEVQIDASHARSKSMDEFADQKFDYIITVCNKAKDACPTFPDDTQRIHWGFDDPAAFENSEEEMLKLFRQVYIEMVGRIRPWIAAVDKQGVIS